MVVTKGLPSSANWWFDPKGSAKRLHNALSALLEDWRRLSTGQPTPDESLLLRFRQEFIEIFIDAPLG
ncbi:hypothetical protein [Methylocystis suflitae]|uniref:hypothetical protein n=1 Tax=Methylocystis suflitae TaxID=2951405 RepID=UPI00210CB1AF|nr:hypothetical protein [Methylocystis suflitae]MCQ4191523.1 hypothetical protein [Methylocystis suflitae]